jgi:flagellin-specific chaperone FliS
MLAFMTERNFKLASLKQRISSLDRQINTKQALVQNLIDQKHELRQSYIVSMEEMRHNIVEKDSGIDRIQDDFNSLIVNLDREEQVLALELDELSNQRDQLRKALLDSNASLFIAKKHVLVFLVFIFFVACAGLLVAHKHVLYKDVPQQQGVLN